ncbi:MAG: hypothetical protein QM598_05610 [Protaetiibacter sp.]
MSALYAYPADAATADALRPTGRGGGEVQVDTTLGLFGLDRFEWSAPVADTITGLVVQLRRHPCGGDCYCAAEVRLSRPEPATNSPQDAASADNTTQAP